MQVTRTAPQSFTIEFESEEELREEHRGNLSMGGLRLPTGEKLALFSALALTLRLSGRGEAPVRGTVVGVLPGGVALAVEGNADALLEALLRQPEPPPGEAPEEAESGNLWDRMRALTRVEKLMLAPKADRSERTLLVQDSDPQVLYGLLKNPRLTIDEVVRIAKSTYLTYQCCELIMKTGQWINQPEVKVALVQNAKMPLPFALRLVPSLPESELKSLARGSATSMALKTAALKRLQGM